jgi:hypothetical protein
MPYLAFDLDAMARAEAAARSIGIPDTLVKGGLLNLWMHCFKEETDRVTVPQVAGFFGVVPIAAPLVAFGFLDEEGDRYRVKGADRYLRIVQGRRKGGQKTAGNLKKGATKPGQSRDRAGEVSRLAPGLSPSTEHRAPNTEEDKSLVEQARPDAAQQVFEHWQQVLDHPKAVFAGKRERAVRARLKEGRSVEDLKLAIDGCAKTPHNLGQNDRGERYDDLELICRDDSNVERFIRNATAPPKPQSKGQLATSNADWTNRPKSFEEELADGL